MTTLPATRTELTDLHAAARRRRAAATPGTPDYVAACEDLAPIEIRIAEVELPDQARPQV